MSFHLVLEERYRAYVAYVFGKNTMYFDHYKLGFVSDMSFSDFPPKETISLPDEFRTCRPQSKSKQSHFVSQQLIVFLCESQNNSVSTDILFMSRENLEFINRATIKAQNVDVKFVEFHSNP